MDYRRDYTPLVAGGHSGASSGAAGPGAILVEKVGKGVEVAAGHGQRRGLRPSAAADAASAATRERAGNRSGERARGEGPVQ